VRLALFLSVSCALAGVVSGCGGSSDAAGRPTVVASFYPLAWVAEHVAAPGTHVVDLTPAGAEPHDLELTPHDLETLQDADLVLYLGHGFQPAVEKAVESRSGPSLDLLATQKLRPSGEEGLTADPHVWLDPVLYEQVVEQVRGALAEADPNDASAFTANARSFEKRIQGLDGDYRTGLAQCARNIIVTSHAAFGYLAQRFGLTQEPISGLSPDAEPTPDRLASLKDLVERDGVTTIFTEELVSPKVAETLAQETGATTAVLNPLESLTTQEIADGEDYVSVMRDNLVTLRGALGCT
jgi:zinc transport system substrate-binding protein